MTNREWLATLSDEEFADWCLNEDIIFFDNDTNSFKVSESLSPHLRNITVTATSSVYALTEWLKQKRS